MQPMISVVMCYHNPGVWLYDAITSIIQQTGNYELILIDDASTDRSSTIGQHFGTNHPLCYYYRNDVHQGIGYSKRRGCSLATGQIIAIVDGDDQLLPNAFSKVLAAYQADGRNQFVYTTHLRCNQEMADQRRMAWVKQYPVNGSLAHGTDTVSAMLTFRRSLYQQSDGYLADQLYATDKQLISRFEELTLPQFVDEAPYLYRYYRNQATVTASTDYYKRVCDWVADRETGLSIIIPYYQRRESLGRLFASINHAHDQRPLEVILACWKDCDVEAGDGVRVVLDTESPTFNRGKLCNLGGLAARYRRLLVLDCDLTVSADLFMLYERQVAYGRAWFPICLNTTKQINTDDDNYLKWGYGMVGIMKRDAFRCGGWPEFPEWGAEDDLFYYKVRNTVVETIRARCPSLTHHAHLQRGDHTDGVARQRRRERLTAGKLAFDQWCGYRSAVNGHGSLNGSH